MRILFYFPHNPWPPRSGVHQRCLQILKELKWAGHEVIFSSSTLHSDQPWNEESKMAIGRITCQSVNVFAGPGRIARKLDRIEKSFRLSWLKKNGFRESVFCPFSLIRWFQKLATKEKVDVIFITYAWFDQLVDHKRWERKHRVMEMVDLVSINEKMWRFVDKQLKDYQQLPEGVNLRADFNAARAGFLLNHEETEIYQRYDTVLSISRTEQNELQSLLKGVDIIHAPFAYEPPNQANTYIGAPILSLGPNPFNLQGYLYFQDAVLPNILQQAPEFRLTVTGSIKSEMRQNTAIDWKGFVENRDMLFQEAGYAVCPVFAGTGQQIKIVEAMAHGLAVVAFEEAARNSFIKHGENGLIASSPDEFARHVVSLENDMELRRRLGQAAKKTIRQEWENSIGLRAFAKNLNNSKLVNTLRENPL